MREEDCRNIFLSALMSIPLILGGNWALNQLNGGSISNLEERISEDVGYETKPDSENEKARRQIKDLLAQDESGDIEPDYNSTYETIKRHEGVERRAYNDSEGIRTVDIGFNLEEKSSRGRIGSLNLDYDLVFEGRQELTDEQMTHLMKEDVKTAIQDAKTYLGDEYWNELDNGAREILINMAYTLGRPRLKEFTRLRDALRERDYSKAAEEMQDSRWYHQLGNRSEELVERMQNIGRANSE